MKWPSEQSVPALASLEAIASAIQAHHLGDEEFTVFGRQSAVWGPTGTWAGCSGAFSPRLGLAMMRMSLERPRGPGTSGVVGDSGMLLADLATGRIAAVPDCESLCALRAAATTVAMLSLLGRTDVPQALIVGTGVQARWHTLALDRCLGLRRIAIAGRTAGRAREFVEGLGDICRSELHASSCVRDDLAESRVAIATTTSREPVIRGNWVAGDLAIAAIGSHDRQARELDHELLRRASLILVDDRPGALACGEFREQDREVEAKVQTPNAFFRERSATPPGGIVVWKSVGCPEHDLIAAASVWGASIFGEEVR